MTQRRMRMLALLAVLAFTAGCGISGTAAAPKSVTAADAATRTIRVQFQAPWFKESQLCTFDAAQSVENGPFDDGQGMTLEDESGTLLARAKIRHVGKVDQETCAVEVVFTDVATDSANYVVVSTIGSEWRLLASEVDADPVIIDFLNAR